MNLITLAMPPEYQNDPELMIDGEKPAQLIGRYIDEQWKSPEMRVPEYKILEISAENVCTQNWITDQFTKLKNRYDEVKQNNSFNKESKDRLISAPLQGIARTLAYGFLGANREWFANNSYSKLSHPRFHTQIKQLCKTEDVSQIVNELSGKIPEPRGPNALRALHANKGGHRTKYRRTHRRKRTLRKA
jgi:hypothetical protein